MLSIFDIFKIGIGPSSSHTVGPMVAAKCFANALLHNPAGSIGRITVDLYGSLALTGEGHGTIGAILNGLEGAEPATVVPEDMSARTRQLRSAHTQLVLAPDRTVPFDFATDVRLHRTEFLSKHANGMIFSAFDIDGNQLMKETFYSIGGGFVVTDEEFDAPPASMSVSFPYPFSNAAELIETCRVHDMRIARLVMANEKALRDEEAVRDGVMRIANTMRDGIEAGCRQREAELPGGLAVRRRAPSIFKKLVAQQLAGHAPEVPWAMLYAMAVSEENATGGRVVTAPTNGAAGIIPAVLHHYRNFHPSASDDGVIEFLLTASAIASLYKMNASISGAEVGCQGEVGVACSMAAGAYCAAIGGTLAQIENAAEIAMEHNLGLTCDPVGGLVQIPCIERNAVAAEKAIKCAQLARYEDGNHRVSLDQVIATMYRTGLDMQSKYKETSLGGLAVTVGTPAC